MSDISANRFRSGESDQFDTPETSSTGNWLPSIMLLALGGVVLWLAFHELDQRDPRTLYNPWTYAVAVPFGLIFISTLLNTFVSPFVERSLQATFLLSVLAHLLFLATVGNFVVFSRPWSDVFDELAQQRQQLVTQQTQRLQAQRARQYLHSSNSGSSLPEADHFRPAPTEHEPSELAKNPTRAEHAIDRVDLAPNPDIELEPTPTPSTASLQRRSSERSELEPSEGILWPALERTEAGGRVGPAEQSSRPVTDADSLASQVSDSVESTQASSSHLRHKRGGRQPDAMQLPELGRLQGPDWASIPNVSSGRTGAMPSRSVAQRGDGDASAEDVARLSGSGGNIDRAAIGLNRPSADPPRLGSDQDALTQELPDEAPVVAANRSSASRSTRSASSSARSQLPPAIDLPPNAISGRAEPEMLAHRDSLTRRSIDASDTLTPSPMVGSIRIERSRIGDSRGPTSNVAVPKPAFSQRLNRLDDNPTSEATPMEPQTEVAIERGLEFLARYQRPDGSWRLQDFDTEVLIRSDTAATALALLSFQGAGYTHLQSKYAKQVDRAIEFLALHQKANGDLYIPQDPASDQNAWLYSHSIASLAMCEAYGMTQDERLRPIAQKAVDFMVASQDPQRGGWRYRPGVGSDTSVTGWYMMALQSGKLAGLEIPPDTFRAIEQYVNHAQVGPTAPHLYRYNPFAPDTNEQRHGLRPTAVMTSVGLLIRLYLGWHRERPEMLQGANFLLQHIPQHGSTARSLRDTYYWYYATQVIFHVGGDHWKRWHEALYPLLIESQQPDGPMAGSWAPMQPVPDLWARYGGRLYVTSMNLLSLEVRYRHLPLYEATLNNAIDQ